jgi:WD40 repeat protein
MNAVATGLAESVRDLSWIAGSHDLAVGAADGQVRVLSPVATASESTDQIDYSGWRVRHSVVQGLTAGVSRLASDSHGRLAIGTGCGTVRIVDPTWNWTEYRTREPVTALAWLDTFDPQASDARLAIAAGHDVHIIDAHGHTVVSETFRRGSVTCVEWLHPGTLATGGHGGVTFIGLDGSATGPAPLSEPIPDLLSPGVVLSMQLDLQGARLTVADLRGEVRITDLRSGDELSVDGLGDRVSGLCWWAGGDLLAIAADDELSIWRSCPDDLEPEPLVLGPIPGPSAGPVATYLGHRLAVGDHNGVAWIVEETRPHLLVPVASVGSEITSLAWSPDDSVLAIGAADGQVLIVPTRARQ